MYSSIDIEWLDESKALDKVVITNEGPFEQPHSSQTIQKAWKYVSSHPEEQI